MIKLNRQLVSSKLRSLPAPERGVGLYLALLTLLFLSRVLFPPAGQAVGGFDVRGLFMPWLEFARQALGQGHLPLWDASQFSGYPFMSNPQAGIFYPPTWLAFVLPVNVAISWYLAFHVWWAGLGMFFFVRSQKGSWTGAALAAVAFAFSGFTAARIGAGHIGLLATDSWLPWILLAAAWSGSRDSMWSALLSGVPFGMAILAGHTTSLLYIGLVWVGFVIYLGFTSKRLVLIGKQFALAALSGIALSSIQLLPLIQFSLASSRSASAGYDFASAFSMPPAHLITLLIPDFFGEPTKAGYWSVPNFEELTYYAGVLPLISIILSLRRPTRQTWFYLVLILVGLLLALGSYGILFPLVYKMIPLFRLARAPGRAALLYTFAASALLGETVSRFEKDDLIEIRQKWGPFFSHVLGVGLVAGFAALAATGAVFAAQHPTDTSGRLWLQIGGWASAVFFFVIGILLLRAYVNETPRKGLIAVGLLVLLLTDLWTFGFKLIRLEGMEPHAVWPDAKAVIGETENRVLPWGLSIFDQNGAGQVGLASVFGYNALEIGANTAFTSSVPDPRSTAYDILGAEYVVSYNPLDQYADGDRPLALVQQNGAAWIYRRSRPMPLARLVYQWELIEDDDAAISRVHQPDFNPETMVILDQQPACGLSQSPPQLGTAELLERSDGSWRIRTSSDQPALLVLAETAFPGWQVTVSGQRADIMTAYSAVRAVCVPAGEHLVEWKFAPTIYMAGGAVTLAALLLALLAMLILKRSGQLAGREADAE